MTMMDDASSSLPKQDSRFSCNICLDPVTEPVVTRCGHLFCWPCLFRWLEPGIRPEEALSSWDSFFGDSRVVDESRRCCPVCKAECSIPTLVPIYVRNEPGTPKESARKTPQENEHDSEEKEQEETAAEEAQENTTAAEETSSSISITEEETLPEETTTGLRQRLRFRSRDSEIPEIPLDDVPSRPAASPVRTNSSSSAIEPRRAVAQAYAARPPLSPHQASLSHGMLLMFQQALNSSNVGGHEQRGVPPLHRTEGDENNRGSVESPRDDATEFLSRLILILASFVILCLLLF